MATLSSHRRAGTRESVAAGGVLLVLAAVVAWLVVAQARFSPAVTVAAQAAAAAGAPAAVARGAAPDLLAAWPAAVRTLGAAEAFTPETLSDKIDGKAELYLPAGFVAMRCQRVAVVSAPASWMEFFAYDMGQPANAFSVYSSQKRHAVADLPLGDYAYRAGNHLCFVHGRFYGEIVATDDLAPTIAAAELIARAFVAATAVTDHADVGQDEKRFPTEDQIPGTVMLLAADVFGFDGLKDVFVSRYRDGSDEVTLYLARRASPAAATQLAGAVRKFFVDDCGGKEVARPAVPAGAVVVDAGGAFDGVFATGAYLGGVHQAPTRESAERWLIRLEQRLKSQP